MKFAIGSDSDLITWRAFVSLLRLSLAGYTDGAVNTLSAAWNLATLRGQHSVMPEHVLAGMVATEYGLATLRRLGVDVGDQLADVCDVMGTSDREGPSHCRGFGD
jgi:hypothetical protein